MPRKVFTAGEVLTASNVNEFLMDQSVMFFADSAARGSAIPSPIEGMATYLQSQDALSIYNGTDWTIDRTIQVFADSTARGSAIPSPIEGMASYLEDSDILTIYNGTSWGAVGSQPTLELIDSTSFSAVASEQLDNVFSATYENYKIIINITSGSSSGADLQLRMASAGTADSTSNRYETGEYFVGAMTAVTAGNVNSVAAAQGQLGRISTDAGCGAEVNMYNPFTSTNTKFSCISVGHTLEVTGTGLAVTNSYDGFQILASAGNMTGTVSVYGYKES